MEVLLTNNVPIFIGAAGALIAVSGMILSSILMKHLWEGLMPYSLLLSILLGVLVIISQSGVESRFVVDDALASALILLQLILSVLYPLDITKKFESEPGAIFYR